MEGFVHISKMKKFKYHDKIIEIVGDKIYSFSNNLGKISAAVYICDNERYPKRIAKKIGEFVSLGHARLGFIDYIFEKGKYFVYLNFKGNFYIYKEDKTIDFSKRCRS